MLRVVLGGLLLVFGCVSCSGADAKVPSAPPLQVSELPPDGSYEVTMDLVIRGLRRDLDEYDLAFDHHRVPADTTWESVAEQYEQTLDSAWERDESVPEIGRNHRRRVWVDDGLFGDQALVVALIENPVPGSDPGFRVLLVASSAE